MRSLITGIQGFVGSHLAEYLLEQGHEVFGISRFKGSTNNLTADVKVYDIDLLDFTKLYGLINDLRPDYIFHLAAQSYVPASWREPADTLEPNVIGSYNLFESVRKAELDCTIQIACSSEEYGLVESYECPINEFQPLRPLSPYAVSKIAMDFGGYQYWKSYGTKIIRTRAFNHEGPRRGENFVISNFCKQVVEIEKGKRKYLVHGNLDAVRDFTDVRDIVRAYLLAVEQCKPGEVYNIASGVGVSIRDVVKLVKATTREKVELKEDPSRMRPSDVPLLIGDATKFRKATGWKLTIPLEQTIADSMDYWRNQ